ncbi:MAG: PAS domain S-box protein [Desulfamplus sp.]|nr:PAS domain S-box protein [Desulfamplus sp.]
MFINTPIYHIKKNWQRIQTTIARLFLNPDSSKTDISNIPRSDRPHDYKSDTTNEPPNNRKTVQDQSPSSLQNHITELKKDIEELKNVIFLMRKLYLAIEDNPCIILITDKNGVIEYVNPAFTKITGYTKEEAIGKTPAILESGLHTPEFYRAMWDTILKGEVWQGEMINRNRQGELQWQFVRVSPMKDSEGNIINYVGIQEDINKQKHDELQLRILKQAVEKSPVSIIVTDQNGNISYVNPYFTALTGYTYEEILGKNPRILKGDKQSSEFYESLWKAISSGKIWNGELCNIKKNGEEFWEHAIITPISSIGDKIDHYVAVKSDITAARKAEDALRDSEYLFKSILASMEQGFWMVDNNWHTVQVNSALCDMLGTSEEKLIGKSIYDFLDHEYQNKIKTYIRTWNPQSRSSFEMVLTRPDHGRLHCLVSPTPLFDQQNSQIGTFAVITDFSKRKELEQQLIEAKNKAENASRVKSEFLANMSHEVRTPMNSILGFLQLALDDNDLTLNQRNKISIAHSSANSLLSLLNDILDLSKIEQKQLITGMQPFDIRELIKNRVELLATRANEKGLDLHYKVAPEVARTYIGDPVRIGQILANIAGNAIKFTNHGKITITVQKHDEADTILFSIFDTGIGISDQHMASIFEPFTQADSSTTRRFGGIGLGTTIAKQLVELMGGKIWLESKEGEGSVFHFTIKMLQASALEKNKGQNIMISEKKDYSGLNILIADDLEENVLLTRLLLQKSSHKVTGVNNGIEAIRAFEKENFDIILMDVNMPEMDGMEATLKIREMEHGTRRAIPIIAVTGSATSEDIDIYKKTGMNECISKPINFKELQTLILKLVQESRDHAKVVSKNFLSPKKGFSDNILAGDQSSLTDNQSGNKKLSKKEPDGNYQLKPLSLSGDLTEENDVPTASDFPYELGAGIDIKRAIDNWSSHSVFADVLSRFYNDNMDVSERIETIIKRPDSKEDQRIPDSRIAQVHKITHALKGLSGNLSLSAIFAIFNEMDKAAANNRMDLILPLLADLETEMKKVPLYIEAIRNNANKTETTQSEAQAGTVIAARTGTAIEDTTKIEMEGIIEGIGTDEANNNIRSLLSELISACDQYSPDEVYPFIKELQKHIKKEDLDPLLNRVEAFDFDGVKEEAVLLSKRFSSN